MLSTKESKSKVLQFCKETVILTIIFILALVECRGEGPVSQAANLACMISLLIGKFEMNRKADQRLCFFCRGCTIPLLPKSEMSSL